MKTIEILTGLKGLFSSKRKWIKRALTNGHGSYCLVGGICKLKNGHARFSKPEDETDVAKVARALRITPVDTGSGPQQALWNGLVDFNNDENTTYEKMMARLDKAIERVQSRYGHKAS